MLHKYLVGLAEAELGDMDDYDLMIVSAPSIDEALRKFLHEYTRHDVSFRTYLYRKSVSASFCERFWITNEEEEALWLQSGKVAIDFREFSQRVVEFFGEGEWSERYLAHYFSDDDFPAEPFPFEMIVFMWNHTEWSDLVAIPLAEIREL